MYVPIREGFVSRFQLSREFPVEKKKYNQRGGEVEQRHGDVGLGLEIERTLQSED